ncbi:MAG: response regulator, partial [Campylobacterales bacterium]
MQPPLRQKHPYRVLYVEDEEAIRMQVQKSLNRLFEEVVVATNGEEGVQAFIEKPSHLIITDVIMPRMDGLEMARRIREIDRSVPIIVITALSDVNRLIEAIDIGVSRFLLKPLLIPKLHEAINKVLKEVEYISLKNELERTNEKLKLKNSQLQAAMEELARTKEAEVELLRLKENYHLQQQEIALRKQNQIMRDELTHLAEGGWLFRNYFRPLDILSGDTYGTAKIGENLYLFYIVDAMGKGLSASVTAIQSASFLNHAIDHSRSKNDFNLERLIRDYCAFIRGQILEEEIVCSLFLMLDLAKSELSVVNFGMPPLYIEQSDKTVISIPANNPPIMGYYVTLNIDRYQLDIMTRIMGYSDGVNELTNDKGVIFGTHLEESFKKRVTPNELVAEMQHFSSSSFDDDITILWIERDQCTV